MPASEHEFEFPASAIAEAAKQEAQYHEARYVYWQGEYDRAVARVEDTIGAKVGSSRVDLQACKLEYSIVSPK